MVFAWWRFGRIQDRVWSAPFHKWVWALQLVRGWKGILQCYLYENHPLVAR
jgi:hypothetical protein